MTNGTAVSILAACIITVVNLIIWRSSAVYVGAWLWPAANAFMFDRKK